MTASSSQSPTIPISGRLLGAGLEPAPSSLLDHFSAVSSDNHLTISGITVHTEGVQKCPLRDVAEPVSFILTARLQIIVSRFYDVPPVTQERLAQMVREVLAEGGITVLGA